MPSPMWNEFDIKKPPRATAPVKDAKFVIQLKATLQDALTFFENQTEFEESAALLSRLMAKRKNSFSKMHALKAICKLNSALCRLLRLDIKEVLANIIGMLPDNVKQSTEVPTRNNFEFTVIRIIGLHKLLQRIAESCMESAEHFAKILEKNFFVDTVTLLLAVVAKIWTITHQIGNRTVQMYAEIIPFVENFPATKNKAFEKLIFPKKLAKFVKKTSLKEKAEDSSTKASIVMEPVAAKSEPIRVTNAEVSSIVFDDEDVGTVVSRETVRAKFDFNQIQSADDIKQFFKEEDKKRKCMQGDSVTKLIPHAEWATIKKIVGKRIISNDHKKAIKTFKENLSNKI